ncbi:hypothetical protein AX16_002026 [Volvariella volvacea WC 439]|nr:hypothetical protein AX16_002026 [Volvariella volvacea WC 439]
MCNLDTEGTKHGCGHYIITKKLVKIDCNDPFCIHSSAHPDPCPHCPSCNRYLGPDRTETVTRTTKDYCTTCQYWYNGPGSIKR